MSENHNGATSNAANEARNVVQEVRAKLDYTLEEMAEELGCTLKTVWRCEDERRLPKSKAVLKNFKRLAKKAGIAVENESLATA